MFPPLKPKGKTVKSRPHLILKVGDGWQWDESAVAFVSEDDESVSLKKELPKKATIVPRVPSAKRTARSKDERDLSRYYNVLLTREDDMKKLAKALEKLDCTENVELPVDPSVPHPKPKQKRSIKAATKD